MFQQTRKANRIMMHRIFAKKHIARLGFGMFLIFGSIFLNLFTAYMLSRIIRSAVKEDDADILFGQKLSLPAFIGIYVTSLVLSRILQSSRKLITNPIISNAAYGLVYDIDEHMMKLSHSYFARMPTGALSEIYNTGSIGAVDYTSQFLNQLVPISLESATALGVGSYLYGLYPPLTFLGMFGTYALYNTVTAKYIAQNQKKLVKARSDMTRNITSMLTNYETIHLFNNLDYELDVLDKKLDRVKEVNTKGISMPDRIAFGQWAIIGGGFAGLMLLTDSIPAINEFVALNFYLLQFLNLFNGIGDGINKTRAAVINLEEIADIFEKAPEVPDAHPDKLLLKGAPQAPAISFDNVSFSYNKSGDIKILYLEEDDNVETQVKKWIKKEMYCLSTIAKAGKDVY